MADARELSNRLADLLRQEHHALADFLVALADFDEKLLWRELGHTSLFSFLHRRRSPWRSSRRWCLSAWW